MLQKAGANQSGAPLAAPYLWIGFFVDIHKKNLNLLLAPFRQRPLSLKILTL
jgi:hypothetical protein